MLVRDHFLGSGQGLADGVPHTFEYALNGLGLRGNVLVHRLKVCLGHRDSSLLVRLQCPYCGVESTQAFLRDKNV
jgi:hypothetical protein